METKECKKCLIEKSEEEFIRRSKNGKLTSWCNDCRKEYKRHYYRKNVNKLLEQDKVSRDNRLDRNRQFIWDYYKEHPCVDCGETDPLVLQFDHVGEKFKNVTKLVSGRYSLDTIKEEINKCEVRCANCHMKKTSLQQGWYENIIK
jgi:hypothetical protein